MVSNCPEYKLSALTQEKIIEIMVQCRDDPMVEKPPSLRTSIGLARFVSQRAQRLNATVDNKLIAESAKLVLRDSIEMRPGRNVETFLKKLLTKVVGVS